MQKELTDEKPHVPENVYALQTMYCLPAIT